MQLKSNHSATIQNEIEVFNNETNSVKVLSNKSQIKFIESQALTKTLFIVPKIILEVFNWHYLQLLYHDLMYIFDNLQLVIMGFSFWEQEIITRTQIKRARNETKNSFIERLENDGIDFY